MICALIARLSDSRNVNFHTQKLVFTSPSRSILVCINTTYSVVEPGARSVPVSRANQSCPGAPRRSIAGAVFCTTRCCAPNALWVVATLGGWKLASIFTGCRAACSGEAFTWGTGAASEPTTRSSKPISLGATGAATTQSTSAVDVSASAGRYARGVADRLGSRIRASRSAVLFA